MNALTVFGILSSQVSKLSTKVKTILTGIVSITNVNNMLHYVFTDGTETDIDVAAGVTLELSVNYTDGHLYVA